MRKIIFEVCAETIDACIAAEGGGAARVELCSALSEGGLTPSHGFTREAISSCRLPIHAMVRPREGGFVYTTAEIDIMCEDILHLKSLGVAGIVLGALNVDASIDVTSTRRFVELALPLPVTFHRAFDHAPLLSVALEDVIATGCDRILTSGGENDVVAGMAGLAALVAQAAGRIEIAVGGGLRLADAARLASFIGARHFHASMRQANDIQGGSAWGPGDDGKNQRTDHHLYSVSAEAVKTMIDELQKGVRNSL